MVHSVTVILSEPRSGGSQQQEIQKQLTAALVDCQSFDVKVTPHLYDLKPDGPVVQALRAIEGDLIVLGWIYPRAMYWVLDANGVRGRMGQTRLMGDTEPSEPVRRGARKEDVPSRMIWCIDLRQHDEAGPYVEEIERLTGVALVPRPSTEEPGRIDEPTGPRWYPVIDFARCTNCLECLNFCLFGVFGLDEAEAIAVEQADACRNGCPACSRICPSGAIMFPEHSDSAIAGNGSHGSDSLRLDLSQLFAVVDPAQMAAAERHRALEEQKQHSAQQTPEDADPPSELDRLVDEVDDLDL